MVCRMLLPNEPDVCSAKPAKALYDYTATSGEELSFVEGDVLSIVDDSEESWWKAEKGGTIALVPATYLELLRQ